MQNVFSFLKVLKLSATRKLQNSGTVCVLFQRIRKIVCFFFLKPDLISKLHLLKRNPLLSVRVTIMVVTMVICEQKLKECSSQCYNDINRHSDRKPKNYVKFISKTIFQNALVFISFSQISLLPLFYLLRLHVTSCVYNA